MLELDAITMLTDTPEVHDLYETFSGELAFDVGASGGRVAGIFAKNFDKVIACEPSPEPFALMAANVPKNVIPLEVAVSQVDGPVEFLLRQMSEGRGYLFTGDALPEWGREIGKHTVDAVTLDSLREKYGQPDLVKIDTEGHEPQAVWGGRKTFLSNPAFVIEIHSRDDGMLVRAMLDWCRVRYRLVRHEGHDRGSFHWENHYWLVSQKEN